jgi:hypothetical protein
MPNAVIDFQLFDICSGGGHATLTVRQDTSPIDSRGIGIQSLKNEAADSDKIEAIMGMAVEIIKAAAPSTLPDLKTLINSMTITIAW